MLPPKGKNLPSVRQRSFLRRSKCALRRLKVSFAQGQSFSHGFAVPAPFTQGSLIFVHEPPLILSFRSFSRITKVNFAQGFTPSTTSWSPSPSKRWRLTFVRQLSFILSSKSILSNGKEKNEQCTSASPPLVREGGPRSGGWD